MTPATSAGPRRRPPASIAAGLFLTARQRLPASIADSRRFTSAEIIGVLGPNGAGKTTLFEMIAGSNAPSQGRVLVAGRDIQRVRYLQRDRLAIHYHQSYQVRHFTKTRPAFVMQPAARSYSLVHLFDEPQFNTQDGYIGFMLAFFRKLRAEGASVFVCLPSPPPISSIFCKKSANGSCS